LVGLSPEIKQQWLATGDCAASNNLGILLNLFGGQLTASVTVDAIRELSALNDFLAPPVQDPALVFGGIDLALLRFCTTGWLRMSLLKNGMAGNGKAKQSNRSRPTWCFIANI
jgi:hypothetical protein